MASIKISLDKRRAKSNGTFPLVFRLTENQKSTSISTGISLKEKDWNDATREVRKSHPNHALLNQKIRQQFASIESRLLNLEITKQTFHREAIVKPVPKSQKTVVDFFEYGQSWVERQKMSGKVGNARAYENTLNRLKTYLGRDYLKFTDINYDFLEDFQANLLNKGVKQNSISFYLRTIRTILNKAIKAKVLGRESYPFQDFSIKHESTAKRAVAKEVIRQIEAIELPIDTPIWHNRNYFLLSFYLIGISFVDLSFLKWSDINDGRVIYKRRKTGKIYNVKLTPKALKILRFYEERPTNTPFILPIIPQSSLGNKEKELFYTRQGYSICNKYLKKIAELCRIEEKVTTYVSRHSWATIARSLGYSKDLIAEALGHEYGNKVTGIYLDHYSNVVIDELNAKVID
ncbi:MAG: site-specific integrase [Saprospiraceae bacterium]|nr:site-specific integrase [Saprospiraceae bacterium]